MKAEDKQTGVSIRFIERFDPKTAILSPITERMFALAAADDREDVSTMQKLLDAREFLKRQIH